MGKARRNKFSIDDREQAVLQVLEGGSSYGSVSRRLDTSERLISRWVSCYKEYGRYGLSLKNGIRYCGDYKLAILEDMQKNHLSLHQISVKYHISQSLVSRWRRLYNEIGISALYAKKPRGRPPKMKQDNNISKGNTPLDSYQALLAENQRLRLENDYLKKLQVLIREKCFRNENGHKPSKS
ncbi:MAG: helix-turn-helix domain-containing protein [Bacteroidales bacterium]|jgi:transposase|nr:helix-turn-helix domain-containing protein [Bacteroidales bacterium]